MPVRPGIDILLEERLDLIEGKRVGLLTNPSGVNSVGQRTRDLLWRHPAVQLMALFGPEHGSEAVIADGEHVASTADAATGVPVYSLYGERLKPSPDMLADLDLLVGDIQDVGVRFYTFIWTLYYLLEAAGENDLPILVLDRPNPLNGLRVEGPPLLPGYETFVGLLPVPLRYGLTIGELAAYLNVRHNSTPADLTVVPCAGWSRSMWWDETGLPWIPPSPSMLDLDTVLVYPGTCFVEGTTLSEGRGTDAPFRLVGAPWVRGEPLAEMLNEWGNAGAKIEPAVFNPEWSKHTGQRCEGVRITVTDRDAFYPVRMGVLLLAALKSLCPEDFSWLPPAAPGEHYHVDHLSGSGDLRNLLDRGASLEELELWVNSWELSCRYFERRRGPMLLY